MHVSQLHHQQSPLFFYVKTVPTTMAMASTRSFLLITVTLCSFLLVLAAAEQGKAILVINDKVRCKSDSSRIISNVPMQLVINNATVPGGTGRTTSDGHIFIAVNLNSTEQLAALMSGSSKAYVTAPPHACGAPSLPAGKVVAAEVKPMAMMTISDHDDAGSHVQRPTITAAADMLLVPAVNGSLLATANKGDVVVHLAVAAIDQFSCVAIALVRSIIG